MASHDDEKADSPEPASAKPASIEHALKKNEEIKETVESAADDLAVVNDTLEQKDVPAPTMKEVLAQNEEAEQKVTKAAEDLRLVNVKLAKEIAERMVIESELATTKTDLADVRYDLSAAQAQTVAANRLAFHDALTGLPNRAEFERGLDRGMNQAQRHGWGLAVLFVDINEFKGINDTYGHDAGDQVLLMVAERLMTFVRGEDMVSRWGGDEFACLCLEVKHEADITRLAEKMIDRITEACVFHGTTLSLTASIGIAIYPADGDTADDLFKNADAAMYAAKKTKKGFMLFRNFPARKAEEGRGQEDKKEDKGEA